MKMENTKKIKLITFQTIDAVRDLFDKGYLSANEKNIDLNKYGYAYKWITSKMNLYLNNENNVKYPIWCWVKCYNLICPKKVKGSSNGETIVKITFYKDEKDVFITDYIRYSFILNNIYIPKDLEDKEEFDKLNHKDNEKILKSFDRCITKESDILQGCVWRINIDEIDKIEFISDNNYIYRSLNYIRKNNKRINWQEEFYKKLK